MQILIGTTNPSKVDYFRHVLDGAHADLVTLRDLGVTGEPQETGKTPEENARIKVAYYAKYAPYVLCADSGLYFDALPLDDPRQPGLHIRTPGGVRLDDEQMIAHYSALSRELGGRALAYYLDGLAVKTPRGVYGFQSTREEAKGWAFYLLDTPCEARREGWPLDSLSIDLQGRSFLDPACSAPRRAYIERLHDFLWEKLEL